MERGYILRGGRTTLLAAGCLAVVSGVSVLVWRAVHDPLLGFDTEQSVPPLFEQPDHPIELQLSANFDALRDSKTTGTLTYFDRGQKRTEEVELIPRGRGRAKLCGFKPFFLRLRDRGGPLARFGRKLKWVAHCGPESSDVEVQTERLRYRIVEAFGVPAFKTQRLRVAYDMAGGRGFEAFVVERPSQWLKRNDKTRWEPDGALPWPVRVQTLLVERALGNTDFNLEQGVNVLRVQGDSGVDVVPYDFDVRASRWDTATIEGHRDWFDNGGPAPGTELEGSPHSERIQRRAAITSIARRLRDRRPQVLSVVRGSEHPQRADIERRLGVWFAFLDELSNDAPPP